MLAVVCLFFRAEETLSRELESAPGVAHTAYLYISINNGASPELKLVNVSAEEGNIYSICSPRLQAQNDPFAQKCFM